MTEARDIYQEHLDEVSRALWDGDFDAVIKRKQFPHVIRHPDDDQVFETAGEFRTYIAGFRAKLDGLGATGYHRVCEQASFDPTDPKRIMGRHLTYILRGGNYLTPPYTCEMVLVLRDDIWTVADIAVPPLKHGIPTEGHQNPQPGGHLQ